jgi:hypothetical protein
MEAVEAMGSEDFKKALQLINAAKLWPENLGEGKPYDMDIDVRLENWMSYICYQKTGRVKEADSALHDIVTFNLQTDNTLSNIFPANSLVSVWAMEKTGQSAKVSSWLEEQTKAYSGDSILVWVKEVYNKKQLNSKGINDATVRILQRLIEAKQQ